MHRYCWYAGGGCWYGLYCWCGGSCRCIGTACTTVAVDAVGAAGTALDQQRLFFYLFEQILILRHADYIEQILPYLQAIHYFISEKVISVCTLVSWIPNHKSVCIINNFFKNCICSFFWFRFFQSCLCDLITTVHHIEKGSVYYRT